MQPTYRLGTSVFGKLAVLGALVCAVGSAVALSRMAQSPVSPPTAASEVVRLEPVVVTISRERFDELYAEAHPGSRAVASAR